MRLVQSQTATDQVSHKEDKIPLPATVPHPLQKQRARRQFHGLHVVQYMRVSQVPASGPPGPGDSLE